MQVGVIQKEPKKAKELLKIITVLYVVFGILWLIHLILLKEFFFTSTSSHTSNGHQADMATGKELCSLLCGSF